MGQQLVEVAERSDPHALVIEPVGALAERITRRLAQQLLVRARQPRNSQRDQRRARHQDSPQLHSLPRADGPLDSVPAFRNGTIGLAAVSSHTGRPLHARFSLRSLAAFAGGEKRR